MYSIRMCAQYDMNVCLFGVDQVVCKPYMEVGILEKCTNFKI